MAVTVPRETEPAISPYLEGNYAPIHEEITAENLRGDRRAARRPGRHVRPQRARTRASTPKGRYHWFDGDGMLHALALRGRQRHLPQPLDPHRGPRGRHRRPASSLWTGHHGAARRHQPATAREGHGQHRPRLPRRASCSRSGGWRASRYALDSPTLETLGPCDFGGTLDTSIAAHAKVDPATGELMFFDYGVLPPYLRYGVVVARRARSCTRRRSTCPAPGCRTTWRSPSTTRSCMDLPLMCDPEQLRAGHVRMVRLPPRHAEPLRRDPALRRRRRRALVRGRAVLHVPHGQRAGRRATRSCSIGCRIHDPLGWDRRRRERPHVAAARLPAARALPARSGGSNMRTGRGRRSAARRRATPSSRASTTGSSARQSRYTYNGRDRRLADAAVRRLRQVRPRRAARARSTATRRAVRRRGRRSRRATDATRRGRRLPAHVRRRRGDRALRSCTWCDAQHARDAVARVEIPQRVPTGYHTCWVDHGD